METQPRVINFPTEAEVVKATEKLHIMYFGTSFKILYFLSQGNRECIKSISDACLISHRNIAHHLNKFRLIGLVRSERIGKKTYYSCVNPEAIKTILETALKL